jgi:Spy/CpxP family protein refolding chaperone
MRKVLTTLAGAALAMTLSTTAAHAAAPARTARQVGAQSHHVRGDGDGGGDDDHNYDDHYDYPEHHCHGLVSRLLCWLV